MNIIISLRPLSLSIIASLFTLAACGGKVYIDHSDGNSSSSGTGGSAGGASSSTSSGMPPECVVNEDCKDTFVCINEVCVCPEGLCQTGLVCHPCSPLCLTDADCDDSFSCTADRCSPEGACVNTQYAPGSKCPPPEDGRCIGLVCCPPDTCLDVHTGGCLSTCPSGNNYPACDDDMGLYCL